MCSIAPRILCAARQRCVDISTNGARRYKIPLEVTLLPVASRQPQEATSFHAVREHFASTARLGDFSGDTNDTSRLSELLSWYSISKIVGLGVHVLNDRKSSVGNLIKIS